MKPIERSSRTIERLTQQFAEAVVGQNDAITVGDTRRSNYCANRILVAYRKLRDIGDEGIEGLSRLLEHERPAVRVTAATFLLPRRTERALEVLRECAKLDTFTGFEATQSLKGWEKGDWHLDD